MTSQFVARLGLVSNADLDGALVGAAYAFLEGSVGYDQFFFDLRGGLSRERARAEHTENASHYAGPRWDALRAILALYEPAPDAFTPYFASERPCTLLIDEIEAIWRAIAERDDWAPFEAKVQAIRAIRDPPLETRTEPAPEAPAA